MRKFIFILLCISAQVMFAQNYQTNDSDSDDESISSGYKFGIPTGVSLMIVFCYYVVNCFQISIFA